MSSNEYLPEGGSAVEVDLGAVPEALQPAGASLFVSVSDLGETLSQHALPHPLIFEVHRSALSSAEASAHKSDSYELLSGAEKESK
ncbi:hypothetical protein N023_11085 [Pseudomonas syringae CC440]|nr:hypothetical protein [Pseudomonas syringae]UOF22014.1 hypothetical protein N023_11085 [Pseudomonas syringae CC440]